MRVEDNIEDIVMLKSHTPLGQLIRDPAAFDRIMMHYTIDQMSSWYLCKRPPGPAGAVIVTQTKKDIGKVLIHGYVGPPIGSPSCIEEDACLLDADGHCIRNLHAERMAITIAARKGIALEGATIYSILKPCYECTKQIILAGIRRIVYAGAAYDQEITKQIAANANVEFVYIDVGLPYANPKDAKV